MVRDWLLDMNWQVLKLRVIIFILKSRTILSVYIVHSEKSSVYEYKEKERVIIDTYVSIRGKSLQLIYFTVVKL